jgi:hypothetical protein
MRQRCLAVVGLWATAFLASCEDGSHRDIGDEINLLTRRNDALVPPAMQRLSAYGRKAVPQIETALHTAAPTGRLHLLDVLEKIGDVESIPVLRHVAVYDVKTEVRQAAEAILATWAAGAGDGPRTRAAIGAQQDIARKRASGEGPLMWGDAGAPGVPTTVGAPEAVGASLEKR